MPARAGEGYARLEGHGGPVKGVAANADGSRALTASFDYTVGYWDLSGAEPRLIRWLQGHEAAVNAVAFHPDGERALSAGDDFDVIVWDLPSGDILHRLEGHEGKVLTAAIAPDGASAASAGWDGRIGLWDLEEGRLIRWLEGHRGNVNDVVFSADGTMLWSASYDGTVRAWPTGGGPSVQLVSHGFGVNHLVVDEAAGWLAYGAVDGAVRVIDLATRAEVADLTAERRPILALALAADRTAIGVGDGQGYISVVDTGGWDFARDFRAAVEGPIWALDWVGAEARLLAGGLADDAAIWPVTGTAGEGEALFAAGERHFQKDPAEMTNGERQFVRKCSICHTLTPDGGHRAGPTLHGLFGRPAGAVEDYSYSEALADAPIVWSDETIHRLFEEGPDHFTPGSKMPMQRIKRAEDREDLISFLRENTGPPYGVGDRGGHRP
ncbi:MAG TPA: c-type cytochrome [Thermohalobaculum sp.]|nr:c-type cytochrome [Thermohalobaculum sp.]